MIKVNVEEIKRMFKIYLQVLNERMKVHINCEAKLNAFTFHSGNNETFLLTINWQDQLTNLTVDKKLKTVE